MCYTISNGLQVYFERWKQMLVVINQSFLPPGAQIALLHQLEWPTPYTPGFSQRFLTHLPPYLTRIRFYLKKRNKFKYKRTYNSWCGVQKACARGQLEMGEILLHTLTSDSQSNRITGALSLGIRRQTCVIAGRGSGHALQHQRVIGKDDASCDVLMEFDTLQEYTEKYHNWCSHLFYIYMVFMCQCIQ